MLVGGAIPSFMMVKISTCPSCAMLLCGCGCINRTAGSVTLYGYENSTYNDKGKTIMFWNSQTDNRKK